MTDEFAAYDAFEKRMVETYPKMFAGSHGGFGTGEGWWPILEALCSNIQSHIDHTNKRRELLLVKNEYNAEIPDEIAQVVVFQIKEKFGGLRFYYQGGDDQVYGMVRMAESWAAHTCETCGNAGELRGGGWMKTLCDEHEAKRQARMKDYD